jgi:hypothetical protein
VKNWNKKDQPKPTPLNALTVILPTEEQTWLLRACLWSGKQGEQAWAKWSESIGDPAGFLREDKDGVKGLLPLLFHSLQNKDVSIDKEFHTYLRTAYLRDQLRSKVYSEICRNLTSSLNAACISAILLKGAALAESVYPLPVLQHSHYLDILINDNDLARAVALLPSLGFAQSDEMIECNWKAYEFVHESKLPLVIHRGLFGIPFFHVPMEEVWARSGLHMISGVQTRLLTPADNLFHICGSVFDSERHESLRWVCDAWFIVHRYPNLDWDLLLDCARRSQMALALFVTLSYLSDALKAPIPPRVLTQLNDAASRASGIGREVALFIVQTRTRGGLIKILRSCSDWRTLASVVQWALFPSPAYLHWIHDIRCSWLLPFYYPYRPLKFIVRQIWFFCRRHAHLLSWNAPQQEADLKH